MKTPFLLVVLVLFIGQGNLTAQALVVDYIDGTVEVQTKDNIWKIVDIGTQVSPDSMLRIKDSGLAELSQGTLKIHLGKDGVYLLSKSLSQAKNKPENKVLGLSRNQISVLMGSRSSAGVTVANMGARGDTKSDEQSMAWAGDNSATKESSETLDSIKTLMDNKDWKGALDATDRAIASQSSNLKDLYFDKALILSNMGMSAGSLKALTTGDFTPGDPQYLSAALLTGSQGLEAEEYDLVVAKTSEALELKPETGVAQNLLLSQALAWKAKGDSVKANALLNEVINLAPKTAPGAEATRLLEG